MIVCDCGNRLVVDLDLIEVAIEEDARFPFRRTTDWVVCDDCGRQWNTRTLRAEAVAKGDLALPENFEIER